MYRFSSKELLINSGMYYYLYRFYDPSLQRWINRDPLADSSFLARNLIPLGLRLLIPQGEILEGANLYELTGNDPENKTDSLGLAMGPPVPPRGAPPCFRPPASCSRSACLKGCQYVAVTCFFGCGISLFTGVGAGASWLCGQFCAEAAIACTYGCLQCTKP